MCYCYTDSDNYCPFVIRLLEYDFYNDCNFTFKDEVKKTHEFYNKRHKNYCDLFRLKLVYQNEKNKTVEK